MNSTATKCTCGHARKHHGVIKRGVCYECPCVAFSPGDEVEEAIEALYRVTLTDSPNTNDGIVIALRRVIGAVEQREAKRQAGPVDNGNTFRFCDYVDRDRGGCVRGAGHSIPHVFMQKNIEPPLAPVICAELASFGDSRSARPQPRSKVKRSARR